ncbi:hypothetical protein BOVA115_3748 [Bacteroides ovatus]|nr:hypothetical protein BOVA115_3748 [Bacteroides ovatus]
MSGKSKKALGFSRFLHLFSLKIKLLSTMLKIAYKTNFNTCHLENNT